jgi:hypothetical protein
MARPKHVPAADNFARRQFSTGPCFDIIQVRSANRSSLVFLFGIGLHSRVFSFLENGNNGMTQILS